MSIDVDVSGPVFDGRAATAAAEACDEAREDVAEFAEAYVLSEMGKVFRQPTGYYESQVETERVSADTSRVHDNGVVYGPWLEGVGSRNFPVTRFKGYQHWQRTKQLVHLRGPLIAEQAVARAMPRMR